MKSVNIKGKPYIEVNERLKYFREHYKDYSLETEIISIDNGICVMKAIIRDPNGVIKATGVAYEKENSTFINKTSYIENCETSAWGRALGCLGIGIDTSIASAEEVTNAINNQSKDIDIFEGMKACDNLEALKIYYNEQRVFVQDKVAFAKLKDSIKEKLEAK